MKKYQSPCVEIEMFYFENIETALLSSVTTKKDDLENNNEDFAVDDFNY